MTPFTHLRHRPPSPLDQPRQLLLVASPLRSRVNLSRLVRLAGCSGLRELVHCGQGKVDRTVARDAAEFVEVKTRRSLPPVIDALKKEGYCCVGLEQTTHSNVLYDFRFQRKTALIIGSERQGLAEDVLERLDAVVEIPVYGPPASYNVVTATTMAVYEYCKQFPNG